MLKYRPYLVGDYNEFFLKELKVPQQKEMLDISLGLELLYEKFIPNEEYTGISRHHYNRDKPYTYVFKVYKDGSFKVKLIPLTGSHWTLLHKQYNNYDRFQVYAKNNDLAQARIKHIVELIYNREFKPKSSEKETKDYYLKLFMDEFDSRKDIVHGREVNIWTKEHLYDQNVLKKWIQERWYDKKTMTEKEWYLEHYDKFYIRYLKFKSSLKSFQDDSLKDSETIRFLKWYTEVYQKENIYPYQ